MGRLLILEEWELVVAGDAPARPEVDDDRSTAEVGEAHRSAIDRRSREWRALLADVDPGRRGKADEQCGRRKDHDHGGADEPERETPAGSARGELAT